MVLGVVFAAVWFVDTYYFPNGHDDWKGRGELVSAPDPAAALPQPAGNLVGDSPDDLAGLAGYRAEQFILGVAGVPGSVSSTCPGAPKDGWLRCNVTYDGLRAEVEVRTSVYEPDRDTGAPLIPLVYNRDMLHVRPHTVVVTRHGVLTALFQRFSDYGELRCERLPVRAVLKLNGPQAPTCYGYPPGHGITRIRFLIDDDTLFAKRF